MAIARAIAPQDRDFLIGADNQVAAAGQAARVVRQGDHHQHEQQPSAPSSSLKRSQRSDAKPSCLLPFLGVGRVADSAILAEYHAGEQASSTAELFTRLLTAARVKLKAGQRIRLENNDESIYVFLSPQADIMTAVVATSTEYPDEHAFQLLTDLIFQTKRAGSVETAPEHGLTKALRPVMQNLVAMYSEPSMLEPPSAMKQSTSVGSELALGQRVEVEYDGAWYKATLQKLNPDGTYRVLYQEDNSYEDVERPFVRVLSPQLAPGHNKELLFCGVGRIRGTTVLAHHCTSSASEAESLELFKRLLAAAGSKLKAGQKVALTNSGGGSVFCVVNEDSTLMAAVMTATDAYPEPTGFALLEEMLDGTQQQLSSPSRPGGIVLDSLEENGLAERLVPRMAKLFGKYDQPVSAGDREGGTAPQAAPAERSHRRQPSCTRRGDVEGTSALRQPSTSSGAGGGAMAREATSGSAGAQSQPPRRSSVLERARLAEEQKIAEELELLRQAFDTGDLVGMRSAVDRAEKHGVPSDALDKARSVLQEEINLQKVLELLERAVESKDVKMLESAIAKAEKLPCLKKKSKKASSSGARRLSKVLPVLEQAQQILAVEQHRIQVMEDLEKSINVKEVALLKSAIAAAEALDPPPEGEMKVALGQAKLILQAQTDLMGQLRAAVNDRAAFEAFIEVDRTDMAAMQAKKKLFRDAMPLLVQLGAAQSMLDELELLRKRIHNIVEDMKGSIRVFCRVRPMCKKEIEEGDKDIVERVDSMTVKLRPNPASSHVMEFCFDSVFMADTTQEEVFEDTKDLVQSAMDGYNVALFAYGQTGSGKTYTMTGLPGEEGISPRTIKELFDSVERRSARFSTTVSASMLELYRNDLVDLLSKGVPVAEKQKLRVRQDKTGIVQVEGATVEECKSVGELQELLDRGTKARAVAATLMNAESSRSHLILSINIESINKITGDRLRGKILLVDLAGSERLKKSGTTGNELKESIEINKSLTALGDVIEGLTKGNPLVPYRNHKLTELMQDVVGGSAKTIMFVNCSPSSGNVEETVQTLKYATRAKKITNKVKKMDTAATS